MEVLDYFFYEGNEYALLTEASEACEGCEDGECEGCESLGETYYEGDHQHRGRR